MQSDLANISRIQQACYREDVLESAASFAAKLTAHPDFCFMAVHHAMAAGYVVALPWMSGEILELDGLAYSVPPGADCLYIHDIAVIPTARSTGTARHLLSAVLDAARSTGYKRITLVAIPGASSYWMRHGFAVAKVDEKLRHRLASYGEGAAYMTRIDDEA